MLKAIPLFGHGPAKHQTTEMLEADTTFRQEATRQESNQPAQLNHPAAHHLLAGGRRRELETKLNHLLPTTPGKFDAIAPPL